MINPKRVNLVEHVNEGSRRRDHLKRAEEFEELAQSSDEMGFPNLAAEHRVWAAFHRDKATKLEAGIEGS